MVAYNFQAQFADAIRAGLKFSTIRPNGKRRHAQRGDMLQLYTGMRTSNCQLIKTAACVASLPIEIHADRIMIDGHDLPQSQFADFAQHEGFSTIGNLQAWFADRYGLPTRNMTLIYWKRANGETAAQGAEMVLA